MRMILIIHLFAPGFFSSAPVQFAALIGSLVAAVSGVIGVFAVIRGQSFAGHAFSDIGTTGGAGAFLAGVAPLWGFLGAGLIGASVMEMVGIQQKRGRDIVTGVVLGAALGFAALFLYLNTIWGNTTGATMTILFGSIFTINPTLVPFMVALALLALVLVLYVYRPLLLCAISTDVAIIRGVHVRLIGMIFLIALAIVVSLSCIAVGAILSTGLLIGPAATALRVTARPGSAMIIAACVGIASTLLGILLAYDSYYWPPTRHGWPVSFFIVTLIFLAFLFSGLPHLRRHHAS